MAECFILVVLWAFSSDRGILSPVARTGQLINICDTAPLGFRDFGEAGGCLEVHGRDCKALTGDLLPSGTKWT